MKQKILQFVMVVSLVFIGACNEDDMLPESTPNSSRTISITASMPDEEPSTRVALDKLEDKSIALTWESGDKLDLAFVQGENKIKSTITIKGISENGKKAQFDIVIPEEINEGDFDLYGVYGGGGLDETDPTQVILPVKAGAAGSLKNVQTRKDVMLYFASKDMGVAKPSATVTFIHLGSLFSVTLKNTSDSAIEGLKEARLVGVGSDENWAYNNITEGKNTYDLVNEKFLNQESAGNYITLKAEKTSLAVNETATCWGWYPPLPDKKWPELKLELRDIDDNLIITSLNSKKGRSNPTAAGKSYYFYAKISADDLKGNHKLEFTDATFTPPFVGNLVEVAEMGTLGSMLNQTQKDTITTMIVKGEINKADFDVMKYNMPQLKYIDLKEVKCEGDKIPPEAFGSSRYDYNMVINTIILPESITAIGESAFRGCTGLTCNLIIPDGLTTIGDGAFYSCSGFTGNLILPDGVTTIGEWAFFNCSGFTGDLILPDGVKTIGNNAFSVCSGFTGNLIIPNGVTTIEGGAFSSCTGFTGNLIIPDGVTTIGRAAFQGCTGLTGNLILPDALTTISGFAFNGCSGITGNLILPDGVTAIGEYAFAYCSGLTGDLILPDNLSEIKEKAFYDCSGFTGNLIIPGGVTTIGSKAFRGCYGIKGDLVISDGITSIGYEAFFGYSNFKGKLILPEGLTTIEGRAFYGCTGFTGSLILPEGLTTLGFETFNGCTGFTGSLILPDGLTTIEFNTFAGCSRLTGLTIGKNVTTINQSAFNGCSNITGNVVFPKSLTSTRNESFYGCNKVEAFQFPHTTPLGYYKDMLPSGATVKVPTSAVATYKATNGWKDHSIVGY